MPVITERDAIRWAMKPTLPDEPWTAQWFFPVDRGLVEGDGVILDASPMFDVSWRLRPRGVS